MQQLVQSLDDSLGDSLVQYPLHYCYSPARTHYFALSLSAVQGVMRDGETSSGPGGQQDPRQCEPQRDQAAVAEGVAAQVSQAGACSHSLEKPPCSSLLLLLLLLLALWPVTVTVGLSPQSRQPTTSESRLLSVRCSVVLARSRSAVVRHQEYRCLWHPAALQ